MFKRTLLAALASVALFAACDKEKEKKKLSPFHSHLSAFMPRTMLMY